MKSKEIVYFRATNSDKKYFIKSTEFIHLLLTEVLHNRKYRLRKINKPIFELQVNNSKNFTRGNDVTADFDLEIQTVEILNQMDLKYLIDIENNGIDASSESYNIFKSNY